MEIRSWETAARVDAQTSEDRTRIRGWAPVMNSEGSLDPWLSRTEWPWIFIGNFDIGSASRSHLHQIILWLRTQAVEDAGSGGPDVTGNRENGSAFKQINVDQVPVQRSRDGTLLLSETDGSKGVSRVGPAVDEL